MILDQITPPRDDGFWQWDIEATERQVRKCNDNSQGQSQEKKDGKGEEVGIGIACVDRVLVGAVDRPSQENDLVYIW